MRLRAPIIAFAIFSTFSVNATFYIDYQGLDKPNVEVKTQKELISPDGYRLLTNDLGGIVFEIGVREGTPPISSFAEDTTFKNGIGTITPVGWSVYIDEQLSVNKSISFNAQNEDWLNVLARIGSNFGYKFVVDWQQQMLQISKDEHYTQPDPNVPVVVKGDNGQMYYIYKSKKSINQGVMIVDGEVIPLKITD